MLPKTPPVNHKLGNVLAALKSAVLDPGTNISLNALNDTVGTLNPMIRYLGPYVTVCNQFNYFWDEIQDLVSEQTTFGMAQRALIQFNNHQASNAGVQGSTYPANGYQPGDPPDQGYPGDAEYAHGPAYAAAIDNQGNADCEVGQRGYQAMENHLDPLQRRHRVGRAYARRPGDHLDRPVARAARRDVQPQPADRAAAARTSRGTHEEATRRHPQAQVQPVRRGRDRDRADRRVLVRRVHEVREPVREPVHRARDVLERERAQPGLAGPDRGNQRRQGRERRPREGLPARHDRPGRPVHRRRRDDVDPEQRAAPAQGRDLLDPPRIFLEGNFFVDVNPGTPSAPIAPDGFTYAIQQGKGPVQFDQLLGSLQNNTRANLQTLLQQYGIAVKRGGPVYNQSIQYWTPAYLYGSQVAHATLGTQPHDLSNWIDQGGQVNGAFAQHPQNLENLITDFNTTANAFARENVSLSQAIGELPHTLQVAIPALNAVQGALCSGPQVPNCAAGPLPTFAKDLIPGAKSTAPMVDASLPFFTQLRYLVQPDELGGLTNDLSSTVPALAKLNQETTPFMQNEVRPASSCQVNVILPWTHLHDQRPELQLLQRLPGAPGVRRGRGLPAGARRRVAQLRRQRPVRARDRERRDAHLLAPAGPVRAVADADRRDRSRRCPPSTTRATARSSPSRARRSSRTCRARRSRRSPRPGSRPRSAPVRSRSTRARPRVSSRSFKRRSARP